MTYKDLVRRLSLTLDGDKIIIWSDGIVCSDIKIEVSDREIKLLPCKKDSQLSNDN